MLFDKIKKIDLKRLSDVVLNNQNKTNLSGIFKTLNSEAGIGSADNIKGILELSAADRLKIKKLFLKETSYNLSNGIPETRVMAANIKTGTEKVSRLSPKQANIEIRSFNGLIKINNKTYEIPCRSSISMRHMDIVNHQHEKILVVENYEAFIALDVDMFPDDIKDALIIYRGDKEGHSVKSFLEKQIGSCIWGWFDADPHGFNLALSTPGISFFFLPPNLGELYEMLGHSAPYEAQRQFMLKHELSNIPEIREAIAIFKEKEKCIMQESMISKKIKLVKVSVI